MSSGLGPTDFAAIWTAIFSEIVTVRAGRSLPAATLHLGQEWLVAQESPPRIVIVPTPGDYGPARAMGGASGPANFFQQSSFNPKTFWLRYLSFDAYIWGNESPAPSSPPVENPDLWYSFSSAVELERELLISLAHNCGGPAAIRLGGYRWDQPADLQRLGRLLVVSFAIQTPVTQEPYTILPYATQTTSGVQVSATIEEVFPDGTSSIAGVIVIPP
jgi:hypothetical protein